MDDEVKWRNDIIDGQIKQLLKDLNAAGYETDGSCQGRRRLKEWQTKRHCEHAYISFGPEAFAKKLKARIIEAGLYIYNSNTAITSLPPFGLPKDVVIALNLGFNQKVRKAFRLEGRADGK